MSEASERSWRVAAGKLDSRQLECFVAVAEELNVHRAAARLHMTQPPLTRRITRLENELRAKLFLRTSTGLVLTDAGTTLLHRAYEVLDLLVETFSETQESAAQGPRLLTIAYEDEVVFGGLPILIGEFTVEHPGTSVRLRRVAASAQIEGLKARAYDVAIGVHGTTPDGLVSLTVQQEPAVLALPDAYPRRAGNRPTRLSDLAAYPTITYPSTRHLLRPIARARPEGETTAANQPLERRGPTESAIDAGDIMECLGYVAMGAGVALVPASVGRVQFPGVRFEACLHAPRANLDVLWRASPTPAVMALTAFLDHRISRSAPQESA